MIFAITDLETTGGGKFGNQIIEVAVVLSDGTKVIDEYQTLIDPGMPIPAWIKNLTGIDDDMVAAQPSFSSIADELKSFLERADVFVAHNVNFDYKVLLNSFLKMGIQLRMPTLCTVQGARKWIPGQDSYNLGKLSESLGIGFSDQHRAMADAHASARILHLLIEKVGLNTLQMKVNGHVSAENLPPKLDFKEIRNLPSARGIVSFYNQTGEVLFVRHLSSSFEGSIKWLSKKVKNKKHLAIRESICDLTNLPVNSAALAVLLERSMISAGNPPLNRKPDVKWLPQEIPGGIYQCGRGENWVELVKVENGKVASWGALDNWDLEGDFDLSAMDFKKFADYTGLDALFISVLQRYKLPLIVPFV